MNAIARVIARTLQLGAVLAGAGVMLTPLSLATEPQRTGASRPRQGTAPAMKAGALTTEIVARHPFRSTRKPADVPYRLQASVGPVIPRPVLVLRGILWAGQPLALLEGVPGNSGQVLVLANDTISGLRVRRVERHRVVLEGFDTTWVLRLDSVPP